MGIWKGEGEGEGGGTTGACPIYLEYTTGGFMFGLLHLFGTYICFGVFCDFWGVDTSWGTVLSVVLVIEWDDFRAVI